MDSRQILPYSKVRSESLNLNCRTAAVDATFFMVMLTRLLVMQDKEQEQPHGFPIVFNNK